MGGLGIKIQKNVNIKIKHVSRCMDEISSVFKGNSHNFKAIKI